MQELEETEMETLLATCILYLLQLIKNFYVNIISSLGCKRLEDRIHAIFIYQNERGRCLVNACWVIKWKLGNLAW